MLSIVIIVGLQKLSMKGVETLPLPDKFQSLQLPPLPLFSYDYLPLGENTIPTNCLPED